MQSSEMQIPNMLTKYGQISTSNTAKQKAKDNFANQMIERQ
jgi:hypothetical protein